MIITSNTEINVEELMRSIREQAARRRFDPTAAGSHRSLRPISTSPSASSNHQMAAIQLPRFGASSPDLPVQKSYNLSAFLNFHDEAFIRNAYRSILNRDPDSNGLAHYLTALRSGRYTKAEILGRLRYSSEGRVRAVKIRGLFLPFMFQIAYRIPVLGYIFAWANFLLRLPSVVRNWSRFEAFLAFQHYEQTQQLNHLAEQAEQGLRAFRQQAAEREYYHGQQLASWFEETQNHVNNALLEQKTDREKLDKLHIAIEAKVDANAIATLQAQLNNKADVKQLGVVDANLLALRELTENLLHKIQTEALAGQIENLRKSLDTKIGRVDLDDLRRQLDAKIDAGSADDWNTRLATKADAEQLTDLINHINTSSEQTQTILTDIQRQVLDHRRNITDQHRRLTQLLEEARRTLPEPTNQERFERIAVEENHLLDAFYVGFEDCFRGTREDIKHRMEIYLPIVREAKAGEKNALILDVGCGRGEWLELLKDAALSACGIDLNRVMVNQCQELGLEVIEAEAISYLRKLNSNSLGAVTGMHIIEHIPFNQLIVLFDEVLRTLKPGGVAIFETPNPENLLTAACNFYYDPTHLNPLPPEPMRFVLEIRGFSRVEIKRLHPHPEESKLKEGPIALQKIINDRFFGEQDYALVAYKV